MTETATFTSFLKKYNEVNQNMQGNKLLGARVKIQKSSSQPEISEIRYSTPIMKVFKIKQVNFDQYNQYYSDSHQAAASPQQKQVSQFKGSPQLYKYAITSKSNTEQSPINQNDKQSTPIHKKYIILQNNQSSQKQISSQSSIQQNQNKDNSPLSSYYVTPIVNGRMPFVRSSQAKSQSQVINGTQKSLYFNTPKSNRQNDSFQKIRFSSIAQHMNKLNESTPTQHQSIFKSQQNIEYANNQQQKQKNFRIHNTNTPMKVQYKIKRNISTDQRAESSKRGESYYLHQSQLSTISQENIDKIHSNNLAISELIKGNKQILKDIYFD